jgi:hypothetical protein
MHPERDDLFVLGMVEASGLGWQGRHEQAEMVARYIAGLRADTMAVKALRGEKAAGLQARHRRHELYRPAAHGLLCRQGHLPKRGDQLDRGTEGGWQMSDIDTIRLNFSPKA